VPSRVETARIHGVIDGCLVQRSNQEIRRRDDRARRLNLEFDLGEFIVLLGPSGSGKTTACRLLAGLETPSDGRIELNGQDITSLPPRLRGIGMVFQNYALYSHKSVFENIAYPLRIRKVGAADVERRVKSIAELLQIQPYLHRKPAQLSGGQAQRVAVARALVWEPTICLMDEPLSNLDALLRLHMRTELNRLHRSLDKTFVFVTHDQEEAMTLATRIAVLKDGKLVQFDEPRAIYRRPANRFVAEFMGRPAMNTIEARWRTACSAQATSHARWNARGPVTLASARSRSSSPSNEPRGNGPCPRRQGTDRARNAAHLPEPRELADDQDPAGLRLPQARPAARLRFPREALHYFDARTGERLR